MEMKRILVIQIARTGDLIQTTPLVQDLQRSNPEAKIDLLALSGNESVVQGMPGLDQVLTVHEAEMNLMNEEVASSIAKRSMPAMASDWIRDMGFARYDEIYNVSAQWLGCWMMRELPSVQKIGGLLTQNGEWLFTCDWGTYQAALLDFRDWNRVNLVDLFRGFAPGHHKPSEGFRPFLARDPGWTSGLSKAGGALIGINPGASEAQRRYPPEGFVRLIDGCRQLGYQPVLVGAPMDRTLCEEIAAAAGGGIPNLAGTTRIPQMAQLLTELDALISNDTGAIHMAAAMGTPVITLSGPASRTGLCAFVHETGPWGEGHVVLQASLEEDSGLDEAIPPSLATMALQYRLGRASLEGFTEYLQNCNRVRAWRSERVIETEDPLGGIRFVPLGLDPARQQNALAQQLRGFFSRNLARGCSHVRESSDRALLSIEADREFLRAAVGDHPTTLGVVLESLTARARRLHKLAVSDPDSEILKNSTVRLQEQITAALDSLPPESALAPLVAFLRWKLKMTTSDDGLEGILEHQSQTLNQSTSWLRF